MNKPLPAKFYIVTWLALSVVSGTLLGWRIPRLLALKDRGVPLDAKVVSITPELHNTFKYSYAVNNKTYEGVSHIIDVAPNIGSTVAVTYLPESPDFSFAGDIQGQIDNDGIAAVLASIILPSFAIAFNVIKHR